MKALLIYPPRTYARMPYLAPYLMKGYVESRSEHEIDCLDLNIRFHRAVWTGSIFDYADRARLTDGQLHRIQIVKEWGGKAYEAMRDSRSYSPAGRAILSDANELLLEAESFEREVSQSSGCDERLFPSDINGWDGVVADYEKSLAASFVAEELGRIDLGRYGVIAFSCSYIEQLAYCFLIAHVIKSRFRFEGKLVIGGSGFTHVHHFALKDGSFWRYFDYGIPYEGEVTFLGLLDGVDRGDRDFEEQNVMALRDGSVHFVNRIHDRPVVHPVPDFSTLEHLYPTPEVIYPILTSKGCYWGKCAFCTHHEGYGQGYSMADNASVRDSILHVSRLGGRHFYFVDEALPAAKVKFLADLFSDLRRRGDISPPRWMAECRVEKYSTSESYLKALKDSGCCLLINGMETGSQRVMDMMGKGVDLSRAREYARICRELGIQTAWMFFIGFPGETLEEARETFELIEECRHDIDYATVGVFGLERGSPVWNNPERYGIKEILGKDDAYRVVFDYRFDDGTVRRRSDLKEALQVFLEYYPDHLELFSRIIDRSCALFFDDGMRDAQKAAAR